MTPTEKNDAKNKVSMAGDILLDLQENYNIPVELFMHIEDIFEKLNLIKKGIEEIPLYGQIPPYKAGDAQ